MINVSRDDEPTIDALGVGRPVGRSSSPSGQALPSEIGGYRILGQLGQGGMGVVYEAEQPSPRRLVALKVVRGTEVVDAKRLVLFEREAAMLARLDHPGIGRIYESGRTEEGRHFFAMELVRGPSLAAWLAARPAPPDRAEIELRLKLFRQICDAVNYAHQRGVIHRDLKPSNIIVIDAPTLSGGSSSDLMHSLVKILDFGLARMTEEDVAATQVTELGIIQGTLHYMSPEQARGDAAAIDLRTDVYALGVILYELLTRQRPYTVDGGSILTALATICDASPRPLGELWQSTMKLDADLVTIATTALEKEPNRRYASAAAFSEDIGRFLTSQPILARPASTMYQLKKLVARRKPVFATAAAALVLLLAASVGIGILYVRSEANLARAVEAERTARRSAETSERTTDFMVELFRRANPTRNRGETVTAKEVMDEGARGIGTELADEPIVQARLMLTIGQVYRSLGLYAPAREQIEKGLSLTRRHLPADGKDVGAGVHLYAQILEDQGRRQEARAAYLEALAVFERQGPAGADGLTEALGNYGAMLTEEGEFAAADSAIGRALALAQTRQPPDPDRLLRLRQRQASIRMDMRQPDSALAILVPALARARQLHGDRDALVADLLTNIGVAHSMAKRSAEAVETAKQALAIDRVIYGNEHPVVMRCLGNIGVGLAEQGKFAEARPYFQEVLDANIRLHGLEHPDVAKGYMNLGLLILNSGDARGALPELQRAVDLYERMGELKTPSMGLSLYQLACAHLELKEFAQARRYMLRAVAIDEQVHGPESSDVADDLEVLVEAERGVGHAAEADRLEARMRRIRGLTAAAAPPD